MEINVDIFDLIFDYEYTIFNLLQKYKEIELHFESLK